MLMQHVEAYLALRRAGGLALRPHERQLRQFAELAATRGEDHVRAETAIAWASKTSTERERRRRLGRVICFARYLHAEDPLHEIPHDHYYPKRFQRPVPHIYTADEVRRLVDAAARLGPAESIRPHTVSTLLALLFATGLRISEALALRLADVTPDGLVVRKTKFGKTRLVPLHPTAGVGLARYLDRRRAVAHDDDHIFVSLQGTGLSYGGFRKAWLTVLKQGGLTPETGGRRPRIHDTRHTFAVRALESASDCRDRIARHTLAVSTYLGHSCVADTYWYFQATPRLLTDIADACQHHFERARP